MINQEGLRLKVCGMKYAANIAAVADLQPDYMGFIFFQRSLRGISDVSAELIKYVPSEIKTTGVFVDENLDIVKNKINLYKLKAVQLHGLESPEYCEGLRSAFGNLEIIKAFGIDKSFDFAALKPYLTIVDYFLFDTKTEAYGGSGKIFDWSKLKKYPYEIPYFLSGGIDLEYVYEINAIKDKRLYALDINSKFETEPGMKDSEKIKMFIEEMKK